MAIGAMAPSRTSRTESTAVFVGRASFQMIPAMHAARASAARAEAPVAVTPGPAVVLLGGATLTPAPVVQAPAARPEAPARLSTSNGIPAGAVRLFSAADVTEPIPARPRAIRSRRRLINVRTVRTVLLALCAGATITLSAEAVMRRPAKIESLRTLATAGRTSVAPATVAPEVAAAVPAARAATVVASTANSPRPESMLAASETRPPSARVAQKRSRHRRSSASATPTTVKTFATWVDPFAAPEATASVAAAPKKAAAAWVDPFVN